MGQRRRPESVEPKVLAVETEPKAVAGCRLDRAEVDYMWRQVRLLLLTLICHVCLLLVPEWPPTPEPSASSQIRLSRGIASHQPAR